MWEAPPLFIVWRERAKTLFCCDRRAAEKEKKRSSARTALLLRAKMCYNNRKAHPKEAFP